VAISTTFGPNYLQTFKVWTDEMSEIVEPASRQNDRNPHDPHARFDRANQYG